MIKLAKLFLGLFVSRKKKHFLIVLQNNNEIRATGGFITKVIDATLGGFKSKIEFKDVFKELAEHEKVDPPEPMGEMLNDRRYKGWTLRDANFDPNFNKSAKKIIEFYNMVYPKNHVEGVLAVNFSFIENLIKVFEVIKLDGFKVTKENLFMYLSSHSTDIDRHDLDSITTRKNILTLLFKKLIKKCVISIYKWGRLNKLTQKSFENRDLQLWLTEAKKLSRFNLPQFKLPESSDGLAVIDSNFLGGKSNRYIKRNIFREVEFAKDAANVKVKIMWEHLGKFNYPLSTKYKGYTRIYIPKNANVENATTSGDFKIIDAKQQISPGEKTVIEVYYSLAGNWLDNKNYNFKYLKQSGVYDELFTESYTLPSQYTFQKVSDKSAIVHENVCSIKSFLEKDKESSFKIAKSDFGPRIISHELVNPNTVEIRFNESVHFSNNNGKENLKFYHKTNKNSYKTDDIRWKGDNTVLHIEINKLPQKEEEFYVIEVSNIKNEIGKPLCESPRKASVVYRSKFFRKQDSHISVLNKNYDIDEINKIIRPHKGVSFQVSIIEAENKKFILRKFKKTEANFARITVIEELLKNNFATPGIITTKSGESFIEKEDSCILLSSFIKGNHPGLTDNEIIQNAKLLAQFHNITENKSFPEMGKRDDVTWITNRIEENFDEIKKIYGPEFKKDYNLMLPFAQKPKTNNCIRGIAHYDFKSDNIMVNENGTHHLIDMFNMQTDDLICDVGKFLKSDGRRLKNFNLYQHSANLFLKEYFALRPKMKKDIDTLKIWAKYWAANMFFFFISKYDKNVFNFDIIEKAKQGVVNMHFIQKLKLDL